jgi:hypothetical protein
MKGKQEEPASASSALARPADLTQLDFELDFFAKILERFPDYVDVLRVQIDRRLVHLRPTDPLAHYNLACSLCLIKRNDLALKTLRRALELGYRDFRYMKEDRDLDAIRHDPRFRQLLREFERR